MRGQIYDTYAVYIEKLGLSNYALLLVVLLLLILVLMLLIGIPRAAKTFRK